LTNNSLDNYYKLHANDHSAEFNDSLRFSKQFDVISSLVDFTTVRSVLDFGCGNGDLLNLFSARTGIPETELVGIDLAPLNESRNKLNFTFHSSLQAIEGRKFDLIIVSHTLEHMLDFQILADLLSILNTNGSIYIEVPNSDLYDKFLRKTPFYYFDRLHINHFTLKSLSELMLKYKARIVNSQTYTFIYGDGHPYPAIAVLIKNGINPLGTLIATDFLRLDSLKQELSDQDLVIWGLGDNFWRLESLGFFKSLNVVALIDQSRTGHESYNHIVVQSLEEALIQNPQAVVVLTMSWGREKLNALIQESNPVRKVVFL
jgi:2-polyprenyl-3-methyl-5-hydroxy-6-metoxy-1,4-benzoquinol methylase